MVQQLAAGLELEDRPCPNGCAADDRFVVEAGDLLHGIAGRFRVMRCRRCGLLRTNPRPTPPAIGAYYPSDYGPWLAEPPLPATPRSPLKARLLRWLRLEPMALPPLAPGRMIEIGCATGGFMEQARRAGWAVQGIEFSDRAAQQARAKGFTVETATVEGARGPAAPVRLVAAWMVLEHLHDPVNALRKLRGWVEPGGCLVASVPDAGALERVIFGERWFALQLPTHLYHYTPTTLRKVLHTAGWELTQVVWQRNCGNLLWSAEYWARDIQHARLLRLLHWLRTAPAAGKLRTLLGLVLGLARQSGRMEIQARPLASAPDA
jgi:2-polyprenyl-3-methyl-5-hydroxy-6-metoxy-1,4-benzoquinol methylase